MNAYSYVIIIGEANEELEENKLFFSNSLQQSENSRRSWRKFKLSEDMFVSNPLHILQKL